MARLISAKGVTAAGNIGSPQQGMKWIVKWAIIMLHTGSGSGTRSGLIMVNRANNSYLASGPILANTGNITATSSAIVGVGDVTSQFATNVSSTVIFYQFPEIFSIDVLQTQVTLISGDTYDYYVLVEEASS
jgi:hypothetical protein